MIYLLHGAHTRRQFADGIDALLDFEGDTVACIASLIPARRPFGTVNKFYLLFGISCNLDPKGVARFEQGEPVGILASVGRVVESMTDAPFYLFPLFQLPDVM